MTEIEQKRIDDLDSVTYGSPTQGQIKIYVNSREDTEEDIDRRVKLLKYALEKLR